MLPVTSIIMKCKQYLLEMGLSDEIKLTRRNNDAHC